MSTRWPKVKLSEVLKPIWREEKVIPSTEYRLLGTRWYGGGLFIKEVCLGQQIRADRLYRVQKDDFVYNRLFAWKGSFALAGSESDGCYVSNEFPCFEVDQNHLEGKFLHWYFRREIAWNEALKLSTGATPTSRNRLKEQIFLNFEIPLPHLAEQRRIVAKIDQLAAKIAEARTLRQQIAQEAEAFLTSTISAKIYSASEIVAHQLLPLESACELITDGAHNTPRYVEEGVPLLTAKNVFWDRIDTNNVRHISREEHEPIYRRCPVRRGDVLFINIGATTGTARKVDIGMEFSVKNVAMLRADARQLDADFLVYLLRGPTVRDQIAERQAQTCQQFLALRDIRNLKVPLPPLSDQRRTVAELGALQTKVDALKRLQAETAAELDALLPSILDRAFKGELR